MCVLAGTVYSIREQRTVKCTVYSTVYNVQYSVRLSRGVCTGVDTRNVLGMGIYGVRYLLNIHL